MVARWTVPLVLLMMLAAGGCDTTATQDDVTSISAPGAVDPGRFVGGVDNPLFPLRPGVSYRFTSEASDGPDVTVVTVTDERRTVLGVSTTVVHQRRWQAAALVEEAYAWYAQDRDGNVWLFGRAGTQMAAGVVVGTAGSWVAGEAGARASIVMWAAPRIGSMYYWEYSPGEAETRSEVLALDATVTVPYGTLTGCLKAEDTSTLQPSVIAYQYYCPGVGPALRVAPQPSGTRHELAEVIQQAQPPATGRAAR